MEDGHAAPRNRDPEKGETSMTATPTLWGRILSRLQGEIPADTLEAYRRASLAIYEQLDHVETHRANCKSEGLNPWTVPPATQAEILCAWNAFVLQTLGNEFLEADYKSDPATIGYVPPITADQALAFYSQVEGWLTRAQQAHVHPGYRLDVAVPAALPAWSEVEPCPNAHLRGMLEAMKAVSDHCAAAMLFLDETTPPTEKAGQEQLHAIRSVYAAASTKARYAREMHGSRPTPDVHERVEEHVKAAIEQFYLLGQLLAMPRLADVAPPRETSAPIAAPTEKRKMTLPGQPGFNMWRLTDPDSLERWKSDPQARLAIKTMWELDSDPARTLAIQAEIEDAFERGDIAYAVSRDGKRLGHFFCCPWAPVYIVKRPLRLGGQSLQTMQQFVFDVTAEGVNLGESFTRHIKVGAFTSTSRVEYGDPNAPPDH